MITKLTLERFKCFKEPEEFTFSMFNILTGINGRGKSTLLQSLLLLSQSIRKNDNPYTLLINGEWVKLGSFVDLINSDAETRSFSFKVEVDINESNKHTIFFEYSKNEDNDRVADLTGLKVNEHDYFEELSLGPGKSLLFEDAEYYESGETNIPKTVLTTEALKPINSFKNFQYISADRLAPTEVVKKWEDSTESLKIGTRGENVVNVLAFHGNKHFIDSEKCNKNEVDKTLLKQTVAWLSFVMEGASLQVEEIENSSFLKLQLGTDKDVHLYKPSNIGFGYSYVLSLIVAVLMAKKGDTIIVENPEAHLHPGAQSRLTQFLATVASSGIQLFVETHSEHVVNAIRLIALEKESKLSNEDVSIYFFDNNFHPEKLDMDENAQILKWPEGFFDQQERDLSQILKLGLFK
jgi:predicted ATPase